MDKKELSNRFISLDVFRGITIALMILVNSPGYNVAYSMLEHSVWNGCTIADLVFPFFIVIVGISSVLALTNLKKKGVSDKKLFQKIITRSIYIFFMGLLLNVLPNHFDFSTIRILGVLQRIAICYFFSSVLFLTTRIRTQIIIIVVLLMGYWMLISNFPLSINYNLVGFIDVFIFSSHHLYTPMFDPEGLLSTLPAIASVLFGNLMGYLLVSSYTKQQKFQWMIVAGFVLMAFGWFWSFIFPINKQFWSSSYVLWTSGLAYITYALCFLFIEMKQHVYWSKPFVLFGKNAMLVYFLHVLFLKLQAIILIHNAHGELVNLRLYITGLLFGHFSLKNASFCYAISYTLFWLIFLQCLTKWRYSRNTEKQKQSNELQESMD